MVLSPSGIPQSHTSDDSIQSENRPPLTDNEAQRRDSLLRSQLKETPGFYTRAWRKLRRDPVAMGALGLLVVMLIFSFGAPLVSRITGFPYEQVNLREALVGPGEKGHLLGSDHNGRDILTRLSYGGRISMTVASVALIKIGRAHV